MSGKRTLKPVELDLDEPGKDMSRLFASSLSPDSSGQHGERRTTMLPLDRLHDNPYQPRSSTGGVALEELASVIRAQGFQGVLTARPHPELKGHYQLTAGHRRREASRMIGLSTLPVIVKELTDEEMVTLAITENIQREDLSPLEEGRIYLLMSAEMGFTLEQIAREVGKKLGYVYNRVRAARAPADIQALIEAKPDSLRAVANLIKVADADDRADMIRQLLAGEITTDDLPTYIRQLKEKRGESDFVGEDEGDTSSTSTMETVLVDGVEVQIDRKLKRDLERLAKEDTPAGQMHRLMLMARANRRARRSKLARISAMMQSFADSVDADANLSLEERLDLATICVIARKLYVMFGVEKDLGD
ncbi:MAG TPA: ParB/RepB/Spo0J family partition protein [Chloroflexia bacterium]|nr:ParB/RepB/Spo0J family partition protein [Chloroflexia bacterium]